MKCYQVAMLRLRKRRSEFDDLDVEGAMLLSGGVRINGREDAGVDPSLLGFQYPDRAWAAAHQIDTCTPKQCAPEPALTIGGHHNEVMTIPRHLPDDLE